MLANKIKKRHQSLMTRRKAPEEESEEEKDKSEETRKGFKRMQTTKVPAKNRNTKNVMRSITLKQKEEHYGLGGMQINMKNKNDKVFDKAENIIEKNGKTIKQTELKTMERKSVIASNKLPLIFKKGKKKKKIKRKKTRKGKSKERKVPVIAEEMEEVSQPKTSGLAVKRGSYLMKKNVSGALDGEDEKKHEINPEEFDSYNINNENISSMENQIVFDSKQSNNLKTMESKQSQEIEGIPENNEARPEEMKHLKVLVAGEVGGNGNALVNPRDGRKKSVSFDLVRTGTFKEEFKKKGKKKNIKSSMRSSKFNSLVNSAKRNQDSKPKAENNEIFRNKMDESPKTTNFPLVSFDLEQVQKKESEKLNNPTPNLSNSTQKNNANASNQVFLSPNIITSGRKLLESEDSRKVIQEIRLDGVIESFGNNVVESKKEHPKISFKLDNMAAQSYFKNSHLTSKEKNNADQILEHKNLQKNKNDFNIKTPEQTKPEKEESNWFLTESFEEKANPKTLKIPSNEQIKKLRDEDVLADYEGLKKKRSASVTSKGMSRSFNETMNNIYEDVEKTLDFIKLHGDSMESGESGGDAQEKVETTNILADLNAGKNGDNLKDRILSSDLLTGNQRESVKNHKSNGKVMQFQSKKPMNTNISPIASKEYTKQLLAKTSHKTNTKPELNFTMNPKPNLKTEMTSLYTTQPKKTTQNAQDLANFTSVTYTHPNQASTPNHKKTGDPYRGMNILNRHMLKFPAKNSQIWTRPNRQGASKVLRPKFQSKTFNTLPINERASKRSFKISSNEQFLRSRELPSEEIRPFSTSSTGRFAWWRKGNRGSQNQLKGGRHIFESMQQKLSRSVPRDTGALPGSQNSLIYIKNDRVDERDITKLQLPDLKEEYSVRSARPKKTYQSKSVDQYFEKYKNPKTRNSNRPQSKQYDSQMHMSWVEKKRANPNWKYGKKVNNSARGVQSSMIVFSEVDVFCLEDMENRLVQLFMKILVYSSKIESLKEKLFRGNPDFSCGPLFKEFTNNRSRVMSREDFTNMLTSFGFNLSPQVCRKMMIFLSKYRYTHQHHKIRSLSSLPQSTANLKPLLSPNDADQSEEPNFKMATSNFNAKNTDTQNQRNLTSNRAVISNHLNASGQLSQNLECQLTFDDFREFLEKLNGSPGPRQSSNSRDGVGIRWMDYHLIRQIIILLLRKLEDIREIVRSLQKYGSLPIFVYLLKFNPEYFQEHLDPSRFNSHTTSPKASQQNFRNTFQPKEGLITQPSPRNKATSITSFMKRRISKNSKKKVFGQDSEDIEEDLIIGTDQLTERFASLHPSVKSGLTRQRPLQPQDLSLLTEEQLRVKARELIRNKMVVDEESIRHFLEFHRIQFMPKDLMLVMSDLGTRSAELGLEMFDRFLFSDLWAI